MTRLSLLLVALAACTFPTDGVPLADDDDVDAACGTAETCNGSDDDCDGAVDEDFGVDEACDGAGDTDSCNDGVFVCDGPNSITCADEPGALVEVCDMADNDCDTEIDEDFDLTGDVLHCGACDHECTNQHGTTECTASTCTPLCDNGAAVCGEPDNGCELVNTNPTCPTVDISAADLTVSGDDDSSDTLDSGDLTKERFVVIRVSETTAAPSDLTATISLTSGDGTDFDLYVYCPGSSGSSDTPLCQRTPLHESDDTIEVGRTDAGNSQTFFVIAEVRYDPSTPPTTCAPWTLTVTGNTGGGGRCAD